VWRAAGLALNNEPKGAHAMNRTIVTGRIRRMKGKAMQWFGSITRDRFYAISGRRIERDGEVLEAFGHFQDKQRTIESPRVYSPN
jgi:uncharacterized protein YjbJ (UPF0337 family)